MFKIGDKVRVTDEHNFGGFMRPGDIAIVVEVRHHPYHGSISKLGMGPCWVKNIHLRFAEPLTKEGALGDI